MKIERATSDFHGKSRIRLHVPWGMNETIRILPEEY